MRWTLSLKLLLWLAVGLAGVFGVVSYWGRSVYRSTLQETNTIAAERMSDVIRRATRHSMMRNARDEVYFIIRSISAQPGLKRIRIYNPEGRISFSTQPQEMDQMVNKNAEACYGCHSQSEPLTRLARPDRVRFFRENSGERVLGLINPIDNEPECSNAACHAHPPARRVLGVLDIQLSMAAADAAVADYARHELLLDMLGIGLVLALCGMLVWVLVHEPVGALMEGTRRFAAGQLHYRIPVRSRDEIGALADSFNHMGAELQAAHEEKARWTETLERRIEEKTAQVHQAVERMAEMQRLASLGKLAAAVAHEINNPLSGVLTYAKLLSRRLARGGTAPGPAAESAAGAEQREWLQIIESETLRCGLLVKNLLTFARQVPMRVEEADINRILERCLRLIQHQLKLQNIEWHFQPEAALPVVCDTGRIQQAVLAILVNAMEAMPRGGLLQVSARALSAQQVEVEIADNGPGIPPDILPHIFEPFFTTKPEGQGIGMGLSVAYGIVQQHGGEIGAESKAGHGTRFRITLPVRGKPADVSEAAPAERLAGATLRNPGDT